MIREYTSLGDWLKDNIGFVDDLIFPDPEIDHNLIGYSLAVDYSERILHQPLKDLAGSEVANFINMRYNSKWIKISEYLQSLNIGTVNSKDITENFDGTITVNSTGEIVNLESAFNTDDFVNSDKQDNSINNEHVNLNTRTRKEEYKSTFTGNQQIINFNNTQLSNVIIKDIINELCLKIY